MERNGRPAPDSIPYDLAAWFASDQGYWVSVGRSRGGYGAVFGAANKIQGFVPEAELCEEIALANRRGRARLAAVFEGVREDLESLRAGRAILVLDFSEAPEGRKHDAVLPWGRAGQSAGEYGIYLLGASDDDFIPESDIPELITFLKRQGKVGVGLAADLERLHDNVEALKRGQGKMATMIQKHIQGVA